MKNYDFKPLDEFELLEFYVKNDFKAINMKLKDINFKPNIIFSITCAFSIFIQNSISII